MVPSIPAIGKLDNSTATEGMEMSGFCQGFDVRSQELIVFLGIGPWIFSS